MYHFRCMYEFRESNSDIKTFVRTIRIVWLHVLLLLMLILCQITGYYFSQIRSGRNFRSGWNIDFMPRFQRLKKKVLVVGPPLTTGMPYLVYRPTPRQVQRPPSSSHGLLLASLVFQRQAKASCCRQHNARCCPLRC
jgi:hypothetical protein